MVSRIYPVGKAENSGFNQAVSPSPVQQAPAQQAFSQPVAQPIAQPVQQSNSGFTPPYTPSSVPEYSAPAAPVKTTDDFDDNALDEIPF